MSLLCEPEVYMQGLSNVRLASLAGHAQLLAM